MTASEFATLLNAKRIGRGRWIALCPAHSDRVASLRVSAGKRTPIVMSCMSQHCSAASILEAMRLTWNDLLGDRIISPEARARLEAESRLRRLEGRWLAASLNRADVENRGYWIMTARRIDAEIEALRDKMDPERARRRKMKEAIVKYGWDVVWERFLLTDKGKAEVAKWA